MKSALGIQPQFDLSAYRQASENLVSLSSKLPPESVHALAREVVLRLPSHIRSLRPEVKQPSSEEIECLAMALVSADPEAGAAVVAGIRDEGVSTTDLYLLFLAEAARRLGEKWASDELTFSEVTIGTSRVLAMLRGFRKSFEPRWRPQERLALFASVPEEQHTIGITMAADLFRREGWDIKLITGASHDEIVEEVVQCDGMLVGLTAHGEKSIEALIRLVLAIRATNPAMYILVSGKIVDHAADILALTGADAFASDIPSGLVELDRLHAVSQDP